MIGRWLGNKWLIILEIPWVAEDAKTVSSKLPGQIRSVRQRTHFQIHTKHGKGKIATSQVNANRHLVPHIVTSLPWTLYQTPREFVESRPKKFVVRARRGGQTAVHSKSVQAKHKLQKWKQQPDTWRGRKGTSQAHGGKGSCAGSPKSLRPPSSPAQIPQVQARKFALRVGEANRQALDGSPCLGKDGVVLESKRQEGKALAGLVLSGDVRDRDLIGSDAPSYPQGLWICHGIWMEVESHSFSMRIAKTKGPPAKAEMPRWSQNHFK